MKQRILALLTVFTLACALAFAGAEEPRAAAYESYRGVWVSDGIAVEVWREDEAVRCRAVLTDGGDECEIREYGLCLFKEAEEALQCFGVTRTRERFNSLLDAIEEVDWSMDDMSIAELRLSEGGLIFSDDKLDAPIALTPLSESEDSPRNEALTFAGLWAGESCTLRAEDHGACYRFTVTVRVDDDISHRWTCTCLYDPDGGTTESEEYFVAGDAEFTLENENRLVWRDLTDSKETVFDRVMD